MRLTTADYSTPKLQTWVRDGRDQVVLEVWPVQTVERVSPQRDQS